MPERTRLDLEHLCKRFMKDILRKSVVAFWTLGSDQLLCFMLGKRDHASREFMRFLAESHVTATEA